MVPAEQVDRVTGPELLTLATALFHWRQKLVRRIPADEVWAVDLYHSCYLLAAAKGVEV